jgi:hypothetical protein
MQKAQLGTRIEQLVKPLAKAVKSPCLDSAGALIPDSPCGRRKAALNGE